MDTRTGATTAVLPGEPTAPYGWRDDDHLVVSSPTGPGDLVLMGLDGSTRPYLCRKPGREALVLLIGDVTRVGR